MDERIVGTSEPQIGQPGAGENRDIGQSAGGDVQAIAGRAQEFGMKARDEVQHYGGIARGRLLRQADSRKGFIAAQIENFAGVIDDVGRTLADRGQHSQKRVADSSAQALRKVSRGLRENSTDELVDRAEQEFRARPGSILAGCFVLGFLGARLLRS